MPLLEYSGILGVKRAAHLLRRCTFGATKNDIDTFAALTPQQAIQQLFRQTLPDAPLPLNPATGTEWVISGNKPADQRDDELQTAFKQWLIGQMLAASVPDQLKLAYSAREKIVFFLHTHFTTIQEKVGNSRSLYFQNVLFRLFALDALPAPQQPDPAPPLVLDFKNLTVKVSVDNAMVALLDGFLNVKGSPNENYARELLELYSIGKGLEDPAYFNSYPPATEQGDYYVFTEQDVRAAANVLSGWTIDDSFSNPDLETGIPRAIVRGSATNASAHDNSIKTFSARLNGSVTPDPLLLNGANATLESALDEIRQLVDLIYNQPETPKHICRKLYRFFVYHQLTPLNDFTEPNAIIDEMANTFVANNYKIQPVIENLLRSQHFYDAAIGATDDAYGGIIKSPLELVIDTIRMFNIPVPDAATDLAGFYNFTREVLNEVDRQGMKFYQPFDVAGYEAYHQFPIFHRSWINVNYLTNRYEFISKLTNPMASGMIKLDVLQFVRDNIPANIASNARLLVLELCKYFLPVTDNLTFDANADDSASITAERLIHFLDTFLSNIDPDPEAAWTDRWTNNVGMNTVAEQLERLFNVMLQTPEYQLH